MIWRHAFKVQGSAEFLSPPTQFISKNCYHSPRQCQTYVHGKSDAQRKRTLCTTNFYFYFYPHLHPFRFHEVISRLNQCLLSRIRNNVLESHRQGVLGKRTFTRPGIRCVIITTRCLLCCAPSSSHSSRIHLLNRVCLCVYIYIYGDGPPMSSLSIPRSPSVLHR